jgi:hypothetical protein
MPHYSGLMGEQYEVDFLSRILECCIVEDDGGHTQRLVGWEIGFFAI